MNLHLSLSGLLSYLMSPICIRTGNSRSLKFLFLLFALFSDLAMLVNPAALRVVEVGQRLERRVESGKMSPEFLRQVNCQPQQLMLNNSQELTALFQLTIETFREHCRKNDLYMIPHFNTILYLHHKVSSQPVKV